MKNLIIDLNTEHQNILMFLTKLDQSIKGSNFISKLLAMEEEIKSFTKIHLMDHHQKEERFLYLWMIEQNKNSDKELINKMIDDHKYFEQKANWILNELVQAKEVNYNNSVNLGFEVSDFLKRYNEHLVRESNFIFLIAEAL
ncbi:MAG: hemerythrin domain-containing protein [Bacteriovoracaceae bacterium]|nr:hemerythrin domain-containing protein [Bacteriovoracaceae bacterium]